MARRLVRAVSVMDSNPAPWHFTEAQESALLAQAAQGAHLGLWHWDRGRDRLTFNTVLREFFGVERGMGHGIDWLLQHIHPDDRARFELILAAHLEGRRPLLECECRLLRRGGHWQWMRVRGQRAGQDDAVAGTFLDVSDKFQETNALSQVAEFLQSIMEHMPIGIAAHTRTSGVIIFVNTRFRDTLGITSERMTTVKDLFEHIFPDAATRDTWRKAVRAGIESGNPDRLRWTDVPIAPVGISPRVVTVHSILVPDRDVVISTVWDETERKKAEQALRQSQAYMAMATALTHVGYFAFDRTTEEITWTAEAYRIFGYEPGAVAPTFALHQSHVAESDRERVERAANDAIDHRERLDMEYAIRRCDGRESVCRVVADVVLDEQGRGTGLRGAVQDVSLAREAEEARRRLEHRLQQARRFESLGLLAGGIAHDFNNLLVAILGHADLAEEDLPPNSPVRENVREIVLAARRAAALTHQMLAYTGKSQGSKSRIDLAALLEEMLPALEARVAGKAAIRFDRPPDLPPVHADAAQLRQVVQQLVLNAAESVEGNNGDIRIAAGTRFYSAEELRMPYAEDERPAGRYLFLEVSDNGCGMDSQTSERVFDPFFSTKFTGRGLGLAAVLGIVRGHGGALQLNSAPGRGSTFRVLLPPVADGESKPPVVRKATASRACVLLIGDDASMCSLGRRTLERAGYTVEAAPCLESAKRLFEQSGKDCQLMVADAGAVEAVGEESLAVLMQTCGCDALILCGRLSQELEPRWRHVAQLDTPFDSATLLDAVEAALRRRP
jgi:PAS domain S-box-containing protein